ncbi:MAG: TetR/AcrR family transcriptional regulator [Polyangiaceae bacterium]|nr:TetR/AcrR family transcriptional regulator [Polyangiaceae bacterium]
MARTATIRDETILNAARELFLSRGIAATTADVAAKAGVSEGTLFKRFKSKDELFRAAMEAAPADVPWIRSLPSRIGKGDVQENLVDLGLQMIQFFRLLMPLMMMRLSNPSVADGKLPFDGPNPPPPLVALQNLTDFFSEEIRRGRIRALDPSIAARTFMAGLHSFAMMEMLLKHHGQPDLSDEQFVRGHVNLLWVGLTPKRGVT